MDKDFIRVMIYPAWTLVFLLLAILWFDAAFWGVVVVFSIMLLDFALVSYLKFSKKEITIFGKKLKYGK